LNILIPVLEIRECWKGAEISAAKHKKGRKKYGPGKPGAKLYQKRAANGPNFLDFA
jgi:hypothetical protein